MYYKKQFEEIGKTKEGNRNPVILRKIDGEEANSQWFVKEGELIVGISQILSQKIYHYYLNDNGPISVIIQNDNYDSEGSYFYVASKKIDNYYSIGYGGFGFENYAENYKKCTGIDIKKINTDILRKYIDNGFGFALPNCINSEIKNIKDNKVAFCNDDGCFKPIEGIALLGVLLNQLFWCYDSQPKNFGIVEYSDHFILSAVDGDSNFYGLLTGSLKYFDEIKTRYPGLWSMNEHFAQELKLGMFNAYKVLAGTSLELYYKLIDATIKELEVIDLAVAKKDDCKKYNYLCEAEEAISYDKANTELKKFFEVRVSAIKELVELAEYFEEDIINYHYRDSIINIEEYISFLADPLSLKDMHIRNPELLDKLLIIATSKCYS